MERPKEKYQDSDGLYYPGEEDDYAGVCPLCGDQKSDERSGTFYNIGPDHWAACFICKVRWCIGSNLWSGWRWMDEAEFKENYELLDDFQDADDIYKASPLYEEKQRQSREYEEEYNSKIPSSDTQKDGNSEIDDDFYWQLVNA